MALTNTHLTDIVDAAMHRHLISVNINNVAANLEELICEINQHVFDYHSRYRHVVYIDRTFYTMMIVSSLLSLIGVVLDIIYFGSIQIESVIEKVEKHGNP
jgi:hypothetical protein